MTDFAVLRAPSQVLFGAGMAEAAGRVAAGHGRRVLVITDPVIAGTPGFATVLASLSERYSRCLCPECLVAAASGATIGSA